MSVIIGDIGNTVIKICYLKNKNYNLKKIIYFNSKNIFIESILKKKFKKIIKNNSNIKIALFSSVVPKYTFILKKFLKKKI